MAESDERGGEDTLQSDERSASRGKRRKRKEMITFCVTDCKYDVIKKAVKAKGWKLVGTPVGDEGKAVANDDLPKCHIHWVDLAIVTERLRAMQPWQRFNHFPGMTNIARKGRLAQNLEKMRRAYPKAYSFYPRTWVLPQDLNDFRTNFDSKGLCKQVFIVKPDAGCQGKGIYLTQDLSRVSPMDASVAQQYIKKPLLIDGFKFDLRVYVLVTSCAPLRVYMFHDGLVRLCTEEYVKPKADNLSDRCMHLTNYAVNKHNDNFIRNDGADAADVGSKRSLKWFMEWVTEERGEAKAAQLWQKIGSLCVKVLISILPTLQREYGEVFTSKSQRRSADEALEDGSHCFEILGVDVMIDSALKPWLIEINHLPSFATDSPMDLDIKSSVIEQTLRVVQAKASDKRKFDEVHRKEASSRLYGLKVDRPVETPAETTEKEVESIRARLEAIYSKHAPERASKLDALLKKYKGKERKLMEAVENKYVKASIPPLPVRAHSSDPIPPTSPTIQELSLPAVDARVDDEEEQEEERKRHLRRRWRGGVSDGALQRVLEEEDRLLEDFDRIFPLPVDMPNLTDYGPLMEFVFEDDDKRLKRMMCPLRRASAPEVVDEEDENGRNLFGNPFLRNKQGEKPAEPKLLPMPGPKQQAAAERLTKGYSAAKHEISEEEHSRVSDTAAYAKQWRAKIEAARLTRINAVALKPKTFTFIEEPIAPVPEDDPRVHSRGMKPPRHSQPQQFAGLGIGLGFS